MRIGVLYEALWGRGGVTNDVLLGPLWSDLESLSRVVFQ